MRVSIFVVLFVCLFVCSLSTSSPRRKPDGSQMALNVHKFVHNIGYKEDARRLEKTPGIVGLLINNSSRTDWGGADIRPSEVFRR